MNELCGVATSAATAAGTIIRDSLHVESRVEHASRHDVKLLLDRECEQMILRVIRTNCPGHAVLSEETGYNAGREPFLWIVDPLDGTVNFHHGIPFFCVSVACHAIEKDGGAGTAHRLPDGTILGRALAGVVYDPLRDELFSGSPGQGASLNGRALSVPDGDRLEEAIVSLSLGARAETIAAISRALPHFLRAARKVRSLGSTALDIAQVAAGRIGAFVQMGTNLWDFAGAAAVLQAAGGSVETREYMPGRFRVIASAPGLFEQVRKIVERSVSPE